MFCPNCNEYITVNDLIKTQVKQWEGTDIEYNARCPACDTEIGRMSWGKLTIRPEFRGLQEDIMQETGLPADPAAVPAPEEPFFDPPLPEVAVDADDDGEDEDDFKYGQSNGVAYNPGGTGGCYCPHCGHDLPDDINLLPRRYTRNG